MKKTKSFKMALFCPLMLAGIMFSTISTTVFTKTNVVYAEIGKGKSVYTDIYGNVLSISTMPTEYAFEFNVLEEDENSGSLELLRASNSLTNVTMFDTFKYDNKTYTITELKANASYYDSYSFKGHTNLTSITLPKTLKKIGQNAFDGCTSLESVVIPGEIEEIQRAAFYGCTNLTSITINAIVPPTLGQSVITNCPDDLEIHIPYSSREAYLSAWSDYADKIEYIYTIADILPDDFPIMSGSTIPTNAWLNENGAQLFIMNAKLVFAGTGTCNTDIKNPLVADGTNYTYSFTGPEQRIITFYMENNQLASIGLTGNSDYQTYGLYTAPHIHDFSYVANDNVITATCADGCTEGWDENPLTLTLVSPANLVYDGNEKNVTFATGEAVAWEAAGLELPNITYLTKESGATEYSPFSGIPTNAGDYMAKITVDGKEAKLQFTIGKATPYIKTLPEPNDIELGKKLSDSTLVGGYVQVSETDTTQVPGLFEWTEPNTTPTLADSDVTLYNVTFTPDDDNFNAISCQVMIRINHTHILTMVNGQAPTETSSGWEDYYECSCGALYEDENGVTPINDFGAWKAEGGNGYLEPLGHNYKFVGFVWNEFTAKAKYVCSYDSSHIQCYDANVTNTVTTEPTCTETGVRTYTATYDGHTDTKTEVIDVIEHSASKVPGVDPTSKRSGYKDAWKCSKCGQYFEDEACTMLIGNEAAYTAWKASEGYLPQLPSEGLSAGAIVGICIGSLFLLLVIVYLIGYFFLYRKGKLDDKKIKVIYKFLPRGEQKLEKND